MKKCILIVVLFVIFIGSYTYIDATSISDLEDEIEGINKQINDNKIKVSQYETEVLNFMNEIYQVEAEIGKKSKELDEIQTKIDDTNGKIAELEASLQNTAQSYDGAQEMYLTRLRVIYENGIPSLLDVLLESKSISDFFSKINVLNSILDYDKKLVNNIQSQKEYVSYVKKDIETQKLQLETLRYDKDKTSQALESSKSSKESKVRQLNQSKEKTLVATKLLLEQQQEAETKLQEEIRKSNYNAIFGGDFLWPANSTKINAGFGKYNPFGQVINHYGVDIGGLGYTSEVKAAARGKVITATTVTTDPDGPSSSIKYRFVSANGYGYGNYVMIDHGSLDGVQYTTVYGHMSSVKVKVGDIVYQGQTIGISGSTGNSSGPHLHFEIRRNGVAINPSAFFSFLR